jgi:hypothetical protein
MSFDYSNKRFFCNPKFLILLLSYPIHVFILTLFSLFCTSYLFSFIIFHSFFRNFSASGIYSFIFSSSLWPYFLTIPLGCTFYCLQFIIIFPIFFIVKHFFGPLRTFTFLYLFSTITFVYILFASFFVISLSLSHSLSPFCLPIFYVSLVYVNITGHLKIKAMWAIVAKTLQSSLAGIFYYTY